MKLEIKHIAPYLEHGLRCKIVNGDKELIGTLTGLYADGSCVFADIVESEHGFESIKPLLKPLSEFESFIRDVWENESDKQVMEYTSYEYLEEFGMYIETIWETHTQYLPLGLYNILLKYHYDVFGLIDNGLAEVKQ